MSRRSTLMLVIGVLLVLWGLVWIGQGLGIVPGSFMTGDPAWAAAGGVIGLLGIALIVRARRRPAA
ncbi:MAG TPA: hypothetical protein VIF84_01910 [Candidatus Limnocylindrales bacterium]